MKVNFKIIDNTALNFNGNHIDLHNNFSFIGLDYNLPEREINLKWIKSSGDWVSEKEFDTVVLTHCKVKFFKVIAQDEKSTFEDHSCLGEITFFPSTSRELVNSYLQQENPNDGDDIKYYFEGGHQIIIHCEQINLQVGRRAKYL